MTKNNTSNTNTVLVGFVIFSIMIILLLGIVLSNNSQPQTLKTNSSARLEVTGDTMHNWGKIDIKGGDVEKVFQIRNSGEDDLVITNFRTSCMCTEVQVNIEGKNGPIFGMHTRSGWRGVIKPGGTADLRVTFDPLFHGPQGVGPVTRMISFNTNDPMYNAVELRVAGNVVRLD